MRRYLFIGGPWDGQWHEVRYHLDAPAGPYLVHDTNAFSNMHWRYYRRSMWVPGWLFPIDLYVLDGAEVPYDTLPGFAYERMPWSPVGWGRLPGYALHRAVTAFNRERLAR